jgi:osmotically inducible protein OsmC
MADRTATASWNGTLTEGSGTVSLTSSGIVEDAPITWHARTEASDGQTSPEELLAAAHAACFAMAFTNTLVKAGHQPQAVDITATATFEQRDGAFTVTTMRLQARASIDGIDEAEFQALSATAKEACPISRAIAGNVDVSLDATLA